jgi:primosomal protein N' (replication factor Y) (superfamily II helicase)
MKYYEVLVSSARFHGNEPLTYAFSEPLEVGCIVTVPLQQQKVLGIITSAVAKPTFNTKEIVRVVTTTPLPKQLLELHHWLAGYYPAPGGQLLSLFLPSSLQQKTKPQAKKPIKTYTPPELPPLKSEQEHAIAAILASKSSSLLHGETGSGKTRVYLELAQAAHSGGKSAVILTPEIGLTPQLVDTFKQVFGEQVVIMHSNLTPADRRNAWLKILLSTEPLIVIGPRSALFTPLKNIGLIVMDEAHDAAYKQEQAPHYVASRVAAMLAHLHNARLVLGTATPLITDYYTFKEKGLPIVRMQSLAASQDKADLTVNVVSLSDHDLFTRSRWLSNELLEQVENNLAQKGQSLIFLNRRGTARLVLCEQCGWQALCPNCDLPLTYHGDTHQIRCHTCGHHEPAPSSCPVCSSPEIVFRSIGTKSIVNELARLFPRAKLQRFDSDNKKAERLEQHYEAVKAGEIDILVGTQLLTKGLDLPRLSLVGIVLADSGLYFPDYTAEERTYQMLTQVIGRVGRGHRAGHVILQTYHAESPAIQAALSGDYESFYTAQLVERQRYGFPPSYYLLKLQCARASRKTAQTTSETLVGELKKLPKIEVIGPSPAFAEKAAGKYTWQIIVKAKERQKLLDVIKQLPANWNYDIDPLHLL